MLAILRVPKPIRRKEKYSVHQNVNTGTAAVEGRR
jgi:hypothetical protein